MKTDHLILYRFTKDGLAYNFSRLLQMCTDNSVLEEKDIISNREMLLSCVNGLVEIASSHGFYGNIWHCYLTYLLVSKENAYSLGCEIKEDEGGSVSQIAYLDFSIYKSLFDFDLSVLEESFGVDVSFLSHFEDKNTDGKVFNHRIRDCILDLCEALEHAEDVASFQKEVALFYKHFGVGTMGLHKAFRLNDNGEIIPIQKIPHINFSDLIGYEDQKQRLCENTLAFVSGKPSNNVLLYGDAGTGKSSSIKATINAFYDDGLRMIEVYKHQFRYLNQIIDQVKNRNYKFIIYMDDLSFEEFEVDYKYLKAVIEGGLEKKPDNVLIYATSNRRHLIRESFNDKKDMDDMHKNDTVQEKLSLYHRFGVTIYYGSPNKSEFMDIVLGLKNRYHLDMDEETFLLEANRWELKHGGYSGRAAQQFIDYLLGKE